MEIKIEKNTVQETLIIPLYGRKCVLKNFLLFIPDIYAKNYDRLDYDFSNWKKNNSFYMSLEHLKLQCVSRYHLGNKRILEDLSKGYNCQSWLWIR